MANVILGKTRCVICRKAIESLQDAIAFPAFVPAGHEFSAFSDGVFHEACFKEWDKHLQFQRLYDEYKRIWESQPKGLSFEEIDAWGKRAFAELFREGMSVDE